MSDTGDNQAVLSEITVRVVTASGKQESCSSFHLIYKEITSIIASKDFVLRAVRFGT